MLLFGLPRPLNNCSQTTESLIDRVVVGKILSYVGINVNGVGTLCVPLRIFPSDSTSEVVLLHQSPIFHRPSMSFLAL